MKNRLFLGIAVVAMVCGVVLVGCKQDASDDWWDGQYNNGPNPLKTQKTVYLYDITLGAVPANTPYYLFEGNNYKRYEYDNLADVATPSMNLAETGTYSYNAVDQTVVFNQKRYRAETYKTAAWLAAPDVTIGGSPATFTYLLASGVTQAPLDKILANAKRFDNDGLYSGRVEKPLYEFFRDNAPTIFFTVAGGGTEPVFLLSQGYAATDWKKYWNNLINKSAYANSQRISFTVAGTAYID